MNPALASKIAVWRQKAADGTISLEEMREAVAALREGRKAAASSGERNKIAKAKAAIPSADDLLAELTGGAS